TFPWGNDTTAGNANLKTGDDYTYAAPVGSFPGDRSSFGVLDLAGNLPEWTADDYALYPGNTSSLPDEEKTHKVIRGGGFMSEMEFARTTNRAFAAAALRSNAVLQVGFRCVADVKAIQVKRSGDEHH